MILSLSAALLMVTQVLPLERDRVVSVICMNGDTILGEGWLGTVMQWTDSKWHQAPVDVRIRQLWQDDVHGQTYLSDFDHHVAAILPGLHLGTTWTVPGDRSQVRVGYWNGLVAITSESVFQLYPDGTIGKPRPAPRPLAELPPKRPPILMLAEGQEQPVACFEGSIAKSDNMRAHCIGPKYDYPIDFGMSMDPHADGYAAAPFLCGDVVVSVHAGQVQARRFTDGGVVSRTPGTARTGSRCLGGSRMLRVEKRSVAIYDVPKFRRRWRQVTTKPIRDVAVCSKKLAILADDYTTISLIDLPSDTPIGP